ncbi:hypothetical protein COLO4_07744 [Corchorus olitorius]|uniref:peptidylprolyl isomerase n=1 Tax=Corchorus olitorius TaxID=93759 RepID=A0A1R3KIN7_9ROSI|nr:hypothetical protein COLO4_07744 [Corchorus olitorius]
MQLQALLSFQTFSAKLPPSKQPKDVRAKHSHQERHPSLTVKSLPRRTVLQLMGLSPISFCIHPVFAAPMQDMMEPQVIRVQDIEAFQWGESSSSGGGVKQHFMTKVQQVFKYKISMLVHIFYKVLLCDMSDEPMSTSVSMIGEGPEAHDGDIVQVNYVCRRSNGYFVHSTVDQFSGESSPVTLPLDENQIIKGLKDVLTGMKVGGKRRALIPPSVGYTDENLKPIPEEVSLSFVPHFLGFSVMFWSLPFPYLRP